MVCSWPEPIKRVVAIVRPSFAVGHCRPDQPALHRNRPQICRRDQRRLRRALVQFSNGAQGTLEVCRVIQGHKCEWSIELEVRRAPELGLRTHERTGSLRPDSDSPTHGFTAL